jgi:small subunit ribosomal protein S20
LRVRIIAKELKGEGHLPNIRSAEKRMRQSVKRRQRNRLVTSTARTYIHRAERQITGGDTQAAETVLQAIRALDKAAEKGIIHKNNAARRKSRLMRKLNAATASTT